MVLITGASKRLGKTIATTLAQHGFNTAIHYNKSKAEATSLVYDLNANYDVDAKAFKADLRKLKNIKDLINKIYKHYNRLDILINNAAIFLNSHFSEITEKMWDDTINTNLKSVFFLSKYASEKMLMNKEGIIINIASLGGLRPFLKSIPYSVSKAGVIMLTKCLAKTLAPDIRVNAIAPGTIDFGFEKINAEKKLLKGYTEDIEIARLVLHLINDYKHLTGQCIAIESGSLLT